MGRSPRRVPTAQELDERLTSVERELAQVVSTVTSMNKAATGEAQWFRDSFTQHREEVRKSFADTATAAALATVQADVTTLKTDVAAIRGDVAKILQRVGNGRDRGPADSAP
jgi:hypothetical protein